MNAMNEWISVKDRLPEPDKDVLIVYENGICCGYWSNEPWSCFLFQQPYRLCQTKGISGVTHWMFLPEMPSE